MACIQTLILFARQPRLGAVKTRLARDVGALGALRFYRTSSAGLATRLGQGIGWQTVIAITPDRFADRPARGRHWPSPIGLVPQGRGDLGQRMAHAFRRRIGPVVIIGTDSPDIRRHHIKRAFQLLGHNDAVFGPALDGGYWLIGLKQPCRAGRLLRDVRWSSPHALADTLANFSPGDRIACLETLRDIDRGQDLLASRGAGAIRRSDAR